MTVQEMKKAACQTIDRNADKIIALGESIFREPELGYKEFKTAAKIKAVLDELGYEYTDGHAVTGIVTPVRGRDHKVNLAIMGELDAVVAPGHPCADPETGAAHSCGHFAQAASVIGVAYALKTPGIMENLDGDITLMHVPAEEFVELEYRKNLIEQGTVKLMGGKQEFIRLGLFDNVDMMIMQHTRTTENEDPNPIKADAGGTGMGFIGKMIQYIGKESHAAAPHQGINALKAAQIGLAAIDANRETFQDKDTIRVHPIITKGGDLVNVVPADVRIETYVRGLSVDAVLDASAKVDRALQAGAYALGAKCIITQLPGYIIPFESEELKDVVYQNLVEIFGAESCKRNGSGGSTDASDVSVIMPVVHMNIGGARGIGHSSDYEIAKPELAYLNAAKTLVCTAIDLLANGAEKALNVKANFKAPMTKEEYLTKWCGLEKGKDF